MVWAPFLTAKNMQSNMKRRQVRNNKSKQIIITNFNLEIRFPKAHPTERNYKISQKN